MLKLFIDSSRMDLLMAIFKDEKLLKEVSLETKGRHSEYIMSELEGMLKDLDISMPDLGEVITTKGPGSFTGVRIGVTIAKTISFALNIPLKSISTLKSLSFTGYNNRVVLMDAKKGRVYATIISDDRCVLEDCNISFDELVGEIKKMDGEISVTVDHFYKDNKRLSELGDIFEEKIHLETMINSSWLSSEDSITFAPSYLKLTDAEIQYNERNK